MTAWQAGSVAFNAYVVAVAVLRRRLTATARLRAIAGSALGAALTMGSVLIPADHPLNVWIVPPVILLTGYWTTGVLFVAPMPRIERLFVDLDAALRIDAVAVRTPRIVAEILELAYVGIYAIVLIALFIALLHHGTADRFWAVILLTDFVCFGMLPWVQTRPPRALSAAGTWRSSWRAINLRIMENASVQVNTFPSGHAAEALAAALLVLDAPWPLVAWMFLNAAAISAGAVFGRYHYAADAIAGWAVALAVWALA